MEPFAYFASVLMGVTLGLLGGGGSILTVPILVYLFGLGATEATTGSLFIVGITALLGSVQHWRNGHVNIRAASEFAVASIGGVLFSRALIVPSLPLKIAEIGPFVLTKDSLIMMAFAALMLASSVSMIRGRRVTGSGDRAHGLLAIVGFGFAVGAVAGFVGAGGGFLIVPALVLLLGFGMRNAIGTSLAIIAAQSIVGFVGGLSTGAHVEWRLLVTVTMCAAIGIFFGSFFSGKFDEAKLKKGFGWLVLVMGAGVLTQQFLGL